MFFCGEVKHLVLDRETRKIFPRIAFFDKVPCDECKEYIKQGIVIISVRDGELGDSPYRTGGWWVIKEDAIKKILCNNWSLWKEVKRTRIAFMPDSVCKMLGLTW